MNAYISYIEQEFLRRGVCTAVDLARALDISQPTLSRALSAFPPGRLHRIGRGRSTRYALHQRFEGLGDHWPLYQIDEKGEASQVAVLHTLQRGAWHVEQAYPWQTLRGTLFPDGFYPGWPWFLDDLRPQGFLGRLFAHRFSVEYRVPDDPRLWTPEHILSALIRKGDDLPGAFVIGADMLRVARQRKETCISREEWPEEYAHLAATVLEGYWPGSSAAGEQPKFITSVEGGRGEACPVIVKFSGDVSDPVQARRADLLIAEHWANESLRTAGIAAAKTEILCHRNRCYLEAVRFDRTAAGGRRHVVSLLVLDAAYYGDLSSPWYQAARRLERDGFLDAASAERMRVIWWFGQCIGNTDMHYGNVSLYFGPDWPLSLAPVYDMSPMALQPRSDGSLPDRLPDVVLPPPEEANAYEKARVIAEDYRERVLSDSRVSALFKAVVNGVATERRGG